MGTLNPTQSNEASAGTPRVVKEMRKYKTYFIVILLLVWQKDPSLGLERNCWQQLLSSRKSHSHDNVKQDVGRRPPRYAPPISGDTIYVMYAWEGDHYCMSMFACQYNWPKRPGDLDLLTLKVTSESRVTWATSVPILAFLGLDLGPMYATDRQAGIRQTASSLNALWTGA